VWLIRPSRHHVQMGVCHPLTTRREHVPANVVAIWFDPFIDKSSHVRQEDSCFLPFLSVKVEHRRPMGSGADQDSSLRRLVGPDREAERGFGDGSCALFRIAVGAVRLHARRLTGMRDDDR
jgi:hypothetical protein